MRRGWVGIGCWVLVALLARPAGAESPLAPRASWSGKVGFFATGVPLAVDTTADTNRDVDAFAEPGLILVTDQDVPPGAQLVQAFLYWAGSVNGTNCSGYTLDKDVDFIPPGWTGAPVRVVADKCECSVGARSYDIQACHADVTSAIQHAGAGLSGTYSVDGFIAKVTDAPTDNASASLVLVYAKPDLKPRRIALYDGLLTMSGNQATVTLDGVRVDDPPKGDLTWYVLEGDPGAGSEEQVSVRGKPGGHSVVLSDATNPADDPMNGTINTVSPPLAGLGGVDIDRFAIDSALAANDTAVETTYTAALDKWWLVYNVVGVDIFAADLLAGSAVSVDLADDADGNLVASPGDTLRYTVHLQNDGTGIGMVGLSAQIPPEAAGWGIADAGGGTDASFATTLALSSVPVPVGGTNDVSFDVYVADVADKSVVNLAVDFDARPHGDYGTLPAPPVEVRRDADHDGVFDSVDNCVNAANPSQADQDEDGAGDACDACPHDASNDADGDGACEDVDDCPGLANADQKDRDHDGLGDACDTCPADPTNDPDHDGVCQDRDDCPEIANPGQEDGDDDGLGDACDACPHDPQNDGDGDGICEDVDVCPGVPDTAQVDADGDGKGDLCDPCPKDAKNDADDDGVCGEVDNCPEAKNTDQKDSDKDGEGDACDVCPLDEKDDFDRDGLCANVDDCPTQFDPEQKDRDGDHIGDACDMCPDDPTNTVDLAGRCADQHLDTLKDQNKGCGCGSGAPDAALGLVLLAFFLARRKRMAAVVVLALGLGLVACSDPPKPPEPTVTALAIAPDKAEIAVGRSQAFTVKATWSDGRVEDVTGTATWASSADAVVKVTGPVATAMSVGEADVSATFGGATAKAHFVAGRALAVELEITPAEASLPLGTDQKFSANATFTDGAKRDVTGEVTWTSADESVAKVDAETAGRVLAVGVGRVLVTGALDEATTNVRVEVTPAALKELQVTPAPVRLPKGLSQAFSAQGLYTDGAKRDLTALVTWESSAPEVLEISNAPAFKGRATALAAGEATVAARMEGIRGEAAVVVSEAAVEAITVSPLTAQVAKGLVRSFTADARFSDGTHRDVTAEATWRALDAQVAEMQAEAGKVKALAVGSTEIEAAIGEVFARASFEVTPAAFVSLAIVPNSLEIPKGRTGPLAAVATYTDGSTADVTATGTWSATPGSVLSVSNDDGARGKVTAVAEGEATVTVRWTGHDARASVKVLPAVLEKVEVSPDTASLRVGLETGFAATGVMSDRTRVALTDVTWAVDDVAKASIADGRVLALAGGPVAVSATKDGIVGTAALDVNLATLDAIEIAPSEVSLPLGKDQKFEATGVYSDGWREPFTAISTWASSDELVAAVGADGLATSKGEGDATLTATRVGVSGQAAFHVLAPALVSIAVSPTNAKLETLGTAPFTATGTYTDGQQHDVTALVTWTSSNDAVATVATSGADAGVVTAIDVGTAVITAAAEGVSATADVEVFPRIPDSLAISAAATTVRAAESLALTVTATYADGSTEDVTQKASFSSSDTAKATVSTTATRGVVSGVAAGPATITASYAGVSTTFDVAVTRARVLSLAVSPATVTIAKGQTAQLKAMASLADGTTADLAAEATWSSSAEGVATVRAGLVTAVVEGVATVSAAIEGQIASAKVSVPCVLVPVINEIQTGVSGSASNEFVELFNPCPAGAPATSLAGYTLVYRSAAGTSDVLLFDFSTGTNAPASIPAQGFVLLAGSAYPNKTGLPSFSSGLSNAGGGLALKASGSIVDSVGYGTATNAFIEGTVAPAPTDANPAQSLIRLPDGTDTNNNKNDFKVTKSPTPGAANVLQ